MVLGIADEEIVVVATIADVELFLSCDTDGANCDSELVMGL